MPRVTCDHVHRVPPSPCVGRRGGFGSRARCSGSVEAALARPVEENEDVEPDADEEDRLHRAALENSRDAEQAEVRADEREEGFADEEPASDSDHGVPGHAPEHGFVLGQLRRILLPCSRYFFPELGPGEQEGGRDHRAVELLCDGCETDDGGERAGVGRRDKPCCLSFASGDEHVLERLDDGHDDHGPQAGRADESTELLLEREEAVVLEGEAAVEGALAGGDVLVGQVCAVGVHEEHVHEDQHPRRPDDTPDELPVALEREVRPDPFTGAKILSGVEAIRVRLSGHRTDHEGLHLRRERGCEKDD